MLSQQRFNEIESDYGCGYYQLCWEKACPCAITTENRGLSKEIYDRFIEENEKLTEDLYEDGFYDFYNEEYN
ncbi:hypothetical protein [Paenibacillus sp. FSL E2-0178]|uniref:hypothetical protein n=1 Tax=Paenibacillus sp. FSL E2-0178 TaxID=2921361 RepID=UPI0031586DD3